MMRLKYALVSLTSAIYLTLLALINFPLIATAQSGDWRVGNLVGLRQGTCIRQGDGFNWPAHTTVPEDNWLVRVKGGPRTTDGRIWWDIDRMAAGDNYGGTGWVTQDQTDTNCGAVSAALAPAPAVAAPPAPMPNDPSSSMSIGSQIGDFVAKLGLSKIDLGSLLSLWNGFPPAVKWVLAIIAVLGISALWRLIGGKIIHLISALIVGLFILILMDATREIWGPTWQSIGPTIFGADTPDLANLLAAAPFVGWVLSLVRWALTRR